MKGSESQKHNKAKEYYDKLQRCISAKDLANLLEGEMWYNLKKDGLYKSLFGMDKYADLKISWKSFTQEIVGYKTFTADWKEKVYRMWVIEMNIPLEKLAGVNFNKLYVATQYLTNQKKARSILADIKKMPEIDVDGLVEYLSKTYGNEKAPE